MGRIETDRERRDQRVDDALGQHLFGAEAGERYALRNAFLQQQLGGLNQRVGVKAPLHHVVVQYVVERDEAHALMVRHERMYDDVRLVFRQPLGCVINRFIKTVTRQRARLRQSLHIQQRGGRRDLRGQHGRIRRNHQVFAQAALQPQARHAERAVLKIELQIARVVSRF